MSIPHEPTDRAASGEAAPSKADRTKQRIVIAGAEAVNDSSFDRCPVSEIARRAGVSTGAFYFHFPNKQSLAHAIIEAQNRYSQGKALAILDRDLPMVEVMLQTSAEYTFDIVIDPLVRAGRLATETMVWEKPPTSTFDGWIAFYMMLLVNGSQEGSIRTDLPARQAAECIVGSVTGLFIFSALRNDLDSLPERVYTMWSSFIGANVMSEPERWLDLADDLFMGRPRPTPLTFDETVELHLRTSRR